MSALTAFQAVYTLLTGSTALMAKIKGVYDVVPEGTAGPYIQLGYEQSLRGRILSDTERVWYQTLDIWSEYQGRKEILEIIDLVNGLLPTEWFLEEFYVLEDPSGWYHGVGVIKGYDR